MARKATAEPAQPVNRTTKRRAAEKRLKTIEARVYEMEQNHIEEIQNNSFLRFPAGVIIPEMRFLIDQLREERGLPALPSPTAPSYEADPEDDEDEDDEADPKPE